MLEAYLLWQARISSSSGRPVVVHSAPEDDQAHLGSNPGLLPGSQPLETHNCGDFEIRVLDIYTLQQHAHIQHTPQFVTGAATLVFNGYIGTTPLRPSLAFSIKTLELYRRLRLRKPSFSVEAFVKVLCDLYMVSCIFFNGRSCSIHDKVPYTRTYRNALSNAFDIYLSITRSVATSVRKELGHDGPNWRVLNACPPCSYKVSFLDLVLEFY